MTAERAAAAPHLDYPPTPWWYFPAVGAWAALFVYAMGALWDSAALVPVMVVLLGSEAAFFGWYRAYRGTWPRLRGAPREIATVMRGYFVGLALIVAAVAAVVVVAGAVAGAAAAFVAVTAGLVLYERRYEAAATATRERLR